MSLVVGIAGVVGLMGLLLEGSVMWTLMMLLFSATLLLLAPFTYDFSHPPIHDIGRLHGRVRHRILWYQALTLQRVWQLSGALNLVLLGGVILGLGIEVSRGVLDWGHAAAIVGVVGAVGAANVGFIRRRLRTHAVQDIDAWLLEVAAGVPSREFKEVFYHLKPWLVKVEGGEHDADS